MSLLMSMCAKNVSLSELLGTVFSHFVAFKCTHLHMHMASVISSGNATINLKNVRHPILE